MQITLTIPDAMIEKKFLNNPTPDDIAEWVKNKVAWELFQVELFDKKIETHSPKEHFGSRALQPATRKGNHS